MSVFDYYFDKTQNVTTNKGKKSPIKADNKLFLCPICRNVWEYKRNSNGSRKLLRYNHLPRYGKTKIVCESCK